MITAVVNFLNVWHTPINFILYSLIFIGTFYVALHNRKLPNWHLTPLWYVGLSALFIAATILFELVLGPDFPLSYDNIGILGIVCFNTSVAAISVLMLISTVLKDIKGAKLRSKTD